MKRKSTIIITEQQLVDLVMKNYADDPKKLLKVFFKDLFKTKEKKDDDGTTNKEEKRTSGSSTAGNFLQLDLNEAEDFKKYTEIADKFISSRSSNLLGIQGSMLADAAKNSYNKFGKYVPVELALAQLTQEGGFSSNPNARPIKTKNPFNVGNTGTNKNVFHDSVQSGIQAYYDLIAKNYLTGSKTATDLLNNFVNSSGYRYAGDKNYEASLSKIASQVSSLA